MKQSFEVLKEFSSLLGHTHWLEGGTLLGAYRDRTFCIDDHDDIDIGIWANYKHFIPTIIEVMKANGFALHAHYTDKKSPDFAPQLAFKKNGVKIDLIFYEKVKEHAVGFVFQQINGGYKGIPRVALSRYYENLAYISFGGDYYRIPEDIENYLEHMYGDWKTPKHRKTYSCYNPEHLKALNPTFKYV